MIETREEPYTRTLKQYLKPLATTETASTQVDVLTQEIDLVETHMAQLMEQIEDRRKALETAFYQLAKQSKCPEKMTHYLRQASDMKALNDAAHGKLADLTTQRTELTERVFTMLPTYFAG